MSPLDILSEPAWQRLTWTLLHFLWQGLALAVLLAAMLWLCRVRQARTRYVLGLLTMVAVAVCPVVTFVVLEVRGGSVAGVGWGAAERSPTGIAAEVGLRPTLQPPPMARAVHEPASSPGSRAPLSEVASAASKHQPTHSERVSAWNLPVADYVRSVQPYLMVGWIAGVILLSARLLLAQAGVHWMGRGRRPISGELSSCVGRLGGRLGLRAMPRVFTSERIREAIVVGLLRPIVLLPACWLAEMTPEVLEAVLAHELAHIRRWDLWVNLFQRLVETLLFYHPAVWWLSRRIRLEREMCCDELAVAATGQRATYATVLELVGRKQLTLPRPELGAAMGGNKMALLSRVRNVLGISPSRERVRLWPAGLLAVLVLLAIWLNSTGVAQPEPGKTRAAQEEERPAASQSVSAEEVMRRYREAVWTEVLPKLEKVENRKAMEIIERVASEATTKHIMPHRDMLVRHFLDQLPKADPIDRSQWTAREIELSDELEKGLDGGDMQRGRFLLWNPVEAAQVWRSAVLARTMTPVNYGKRALLQMQTPTRSVALDSDLAHPVIAMATGDELFVVGLRRTEEGLYIRDKLEWLRKKPGATQDYSILPADASPPQKLLQVFGDAVWAELAPKLATMEMEEIQREIGTLAGKYLAPQKDVLAAEAGRILQELPKSEVIDRSQWRPKFPDFTAKDLEDLQGAMRAEALKHEHVALAFGAWHPVRMAAMMRMRIMLQLTGSEALGIRSMIERIASPPADAEADADPEQPVIVTQTGDEVMIVGLKRNPQGCYELERFEWLTKTPPGEGQVSLAGPNQPKAQAMGKQPQTSNLARSKVTTSPPVAEAFERIAWGETVDGIRCGVRPVKASFAPDEDIAVDVLYRNVSQGPITVCVHPDPFYTWVHLRVDTPGGMMALVGQHANGIYPPLGASDFVTLKPGQTASFRQLIAHHRKPEIQLKPGRPYVIRAEINKINRMDRHLLGLEEFCKKHGIPRPWCSGIESGQAPLTIVPKQPAEQPSTASASAVPLSEILVMERVERLYEHIKWFSIDISYHGPGDGKFYDLRLIVTKAGGNAGPPKMVLDLPSKQAVSVIDCLRKDGFLLRARNPYRPVKIPPPSGPAYTLTVNDGYQTLYEDLGWGAPMLTRLKSLRAVLAGEPAKAMDKLLALLEPHRKKSEEEATTQPAVQPVPGVEYYRKQYAWYKQWILKAVKAGDKDQVLKITQDFNQSIEGRLLFVRVTRIDPPAKYDTLINMPFGEKRISLPNVHYATLEEVHVTKWDGYVLLETGKNQDRTYTDNVYITMALESKAAGRADQLKAAIDEFRLAIWYCPEQPDVHYNLTLSVLAAAQAPLCPFHVARAKWKDQVRIVPIGRDQATKIIDHLAAEGFLDGSRNVHGMPLEPCAFAGTVLTVDGPDKTLLREEIGWRLPMLKRLDALRKVFEGDAAKAMDQLLAGLQGHRKQWEKAADGQAAASKGAKAEARPRAAQGNSGSEDEPAWSKPAGDLSGRLDFAKTRINTSEFLDGSLRLRNVGTSPLAVQTGNPFALNVEVKDQQGNQ